jgi:hypothetical protein
MPPKKTDEPLGPFKFGKAASAKKVMLANKLSNAIDDVAAAAIVHCFTLGTVAAMTPSIALSIANSNVPFVSADEIQESCLDSSLSSKSNLSASFVMLCLVVMGKSNVGAVGRAARTAKWQPVAACLRRATCSAS